MARVNSIIKIQGSIEGLTFYQFKGKPVVRRKGGGFNTKALLHGANHVRTREVNKEFGRCSTTGKQLRRSLVPLLLPKEYDWLPQQVSQLIVALKDCDEVSARGQRSAGIGAETADGRALLKGFTFNRGVSLHSIFLAQIVVDADGGGITVGAFVAAKALKFPKGATHCRFSFGVLRFDFGSEQRVPAFAEQLVVGKDAVVAEVHIAVAAVPGGVGMVLPFLKVEFLQEVNGEFFVFRGKEFGALGFLF